MDDSGTIDPAALNASSSTIAPNLLTQPSPRGMKRGRTDDDDHLGPQTHLAQGGMYEVKSNKRSRPFDPTSSSTAGADVAPSSQQMLAPIAPPVQTPHIKPEALPHSSPAHTSPQRTPGSASKPAVVKALPTVRDHTTDQLNDEHDEYIYREIDPDGENKVSKDGYALTARKYKCRTFTVPNRGEKLFMLATECARVLGYRDSYLLFNKNRSLFKIIANQVEKDNLIQQDILPYSYRSRQIAIVTARSMFRQFGSRLIEGGRRVRDDYWEAKARKQGFTEEDAAGEKRPGAAKARAAAEGANNTAATAAAAAVLTSLPQNEIIYNTNGLDTAPPGLSQQQSLAPLPMIHLPSEELRPSGYGNIIRPRQEVAGAPYQDRTHPSTTTELLTQASQAAEWNKELALTRQHRTSYLNDYWRRPHEQPVQQTSQAEADVGTVAPQNLHSPQAVTNSAAAQSRMQPEQMTHPSSQMMPQIYSAYSSNQQNPMASPVQAMHRSLPPGQLHHGSPQSIPGATGTRQNPAYGAYSSGQMWPPHAQASPMSQNHVMSQYGQQQGQQQQHQHQHQQQQQQQHQPQHQQQQQQQHQQQQHHSPMPPPQIPGQAGMSYGQMNTMPNPNTFASMGRSMYQPSPGPQQFNLQQNQQSMQGWNASGSVPQYGQGF